MESTPAKRKREDGAPEAPVLTERQLMNRCKEAIELGDSTLLMKWVHLLEEASVKKGWLLEILRFSANSNAVGCVSMVTTHLEPILRLRTGKWLENRIDNSRAVRCVLCAAVVYPESINLLSFCPVDVLRRSLFTLVSELDAGERLILLIRRLRSLRRIDAKDVARIFTAMFKDSTSAEFVINVTREFSRLRISVDTAFLLTSGLTVNLNLVRADLREVFTFIFRPITFHAPVSIRILNWISLHQDVTTLEHVLFSRVDGAALTHRRAYTSHVLPFLVKNDHFDLLVRLLVESNLVLDELKSLHQLIGVHSHCSCSDAEPSVRAEAVAFPVSRDLLCRLVRLDYDIADQFIEICIAMKWSLPEEISSKLHLLFRICVGSVEDSIVRSAMNLELLSIFLSIATEVCAEIDHLKKRVCVGNIIPFYLASNRILAQTQRRILFSSVANPTWNNEFDCLLPRK